MCFFVGVRGSGGGRGCDGTLPLAVKASLLFWWKWRGLMPVGSRLVGCVRPRMSGMHYTFCLPEFQKKTKEKKNSPYISLSMWSKWQLHGHPVTSGSRSGTLARQLAMWLASTWKNLLLKNKRRCMSRSVESCFVSPSKQWQEPSAVDVVAWAGTRQTDRGQQLGAKI